MMLRDFKFLRRKPPPPPPEAENLHPCPPPPSSASASDPSRPPLSAIQDPRFRTPEKPPPPPAARSKFGWAPAPADSASDDLPPPGRGYGVLTPRLHRRPSSLQSDTSSTHSTPTKSVNKPPAAGRPPLGLGPRTACFSAEVPHFELREDPSFWLDHNVQVVIRIRPLDSTERSLQGYSRCLKQESAQCVSWIGQPDARFTFDYVACETIKQEMLFRVTGLPMVENCMSGYNCCMFAYGQTGSGKTYTMLGEIDELEMKPSVDRGMTPRIFEFLFARIRAEEESRRDEKLKYSCKCSFLEIYNEQITDLLDPSSTNLLLREDLRKGVYVENLSEFEVETVNDILKLLMQGAANRKVAATNMNRESSRSHSVFTCVIESRWEKDSTVNLRFARLNLVDLAGSERQKTSGAEGDRLKEAASINKSLSTLGHVIMILADVAHGKQRHIPYRDSRLTFLLQDSLGGNSKTIIMANVTPSICSANETLSTLKFAQRARLIQNNAVVNEDTSGDIIALQHQIRILKDELSAVKRQNTPRPSSPGSSVPDDSEMESFEVPASKRLRGRLHMNGDEFHENEASCSVRVSTKQLKSLEATLAGALRREKMADDTIKQLEAEIEQLNRLVRQREEDTQCSKMKLKFREDKIHRMEVLVNGLMPTDTYLIEENNALSEEIQLLRTKVDRNPEVTRFALENIRLLDQVRRFQDFCEEGERELLLGEVSELRNQLIQYLDVKPELDQFHEADMASQLKRTSQELEDCSKNLKSCLEINAKLTREINILRIESNNVQPSSCDQHVNYESQNLKHSLASSYKDLRIHTMKAESEFGINNAEEILKLQLELDTLKTLIGEKSSHVEVEEKVIHVNHELEAENETIARSSDLKESSLHELKDTKAVIEALETQQVISLNELDDLRDCNDKYAVLLRTQEREISMLRKQLGEQFEGEGRLSFAHEDKKDLSPKNVSFDNSPLQVKLKRMQASVDMVCSLNMRYQSDQASQTSIEQEMEEIRRQVEIETTEVIVCLQEELTALQQQASVSNQNELLAKNRLSTIETENKELHERLSLVAKDNETLSELLGEKEAKLRSLTEDWESFASEIVDVLANGCTSLEDASDQVSSISHSVPQRIWISEKVGRMIRNISERDALIEEIQKCLEDAHNVKCDMELKLRSLRGAMMAITEAQQQETCEKDRKILLLTSQLSERDAAITEVQSRIDRGQEQLRRAEKCVTVAFVIVNRLSETNKAQFQELENVRATLYESEEKSFQKDALLQHHASLHSLAVTQIQSLQVELEMSQEHTAQLKHAEEQERKMQKEDEDSALSIIADNIARAKRTISKIKIGTCTKNSCISENVEQVHRLSAVQTSGNDCIDTDDYNSEPLIETKSIQNVANNESENAQSVPGGSPYRLCTKTHGSQCRMLLEDTSDRETIVSLLQKETESAVESLKDIQEQMFKLLNERDEVNKSEIQCRESMEHLSVEVLRLKSNIIDKEQQFNTRLTEVEHKLQTVEGDAVASEEYMRKAKKVLELEISDAKSVAAQRAEESSNLLRKIEEAQEAMGDANVMVNALVEANESLKLEIERYQKSETLLKNEKKCLSSEIQDLKSSIDRKEHDYEYVQKSFLLNLTEASSLVLALEDAFRQMNATYTEKFEMITSDIEYLKHQFHQYTEFARGCLEDTWSDIIGKDYALSVLHLCHMGILLERITGLNAENGFLYHGLCESNSVIGDLKEHNVRAKKDLEVCSLLKGKLLLDINNSFNRITKKEEETDEFKSKLNSFEKKILFLQSQEESMLDRSNSMGNELAILMKELDSANRNTLTEVSIKQKLLGENEELHKQLKETSQLLEEEKRIHEMLRNLVCKELDQLSEISNANFYVKREMMSCNTGMREEPDIYQMLVETHSESILRDMLAKDFELLVVTSELEHKNVEFNSMALQILDLSRQRDIFSEVIEKMKKELLLHMIDGELNNTEVSSLLVDKEKLKIELLKLKDDHSRTTEDLQEAKIELASSVSYANILERKNDKLQDMVTILQTEVERKREELEENQCSLLADKENLETELLKLKDDHFRNMEDLQEAKIGLTSSISHVSILEQKNDKLQDMITVLQTELERKSEELEEIQCAHSVMSKKLDWKNVVAEVQVERINALEAENDSVKNEVTVISKELDLFHVARINALEMENDSLKNEANTFKQKKDEIITTLNVKLENFLDIPDTVDQALDRMFHVTDEHIARMMHTQSQETLEHKEAASEFVDKLEFLTQSVKELMSETFSLRSELTLKEEVFKGLLSDLSLLQESASIAKDQKHQLEEMATAFESLEVELASKSRELDEIVSHAQIHQAELVEKNERISALELKIAENYDKFSLVSAENHELKAYIKHILEIKDTLEQELKERTEVTERLEDEIIAMSTLLSQRNLSLQDLQNDLNKIESEKEHLDSVVAMLKEQLEMTQALAEENEAIATESHQIAEERKAYAENKEEEVKLLERSVEELERTVNALENKVDLVKGEAERQRLHREEVQMELERGRNQILTVPTSDDIWNATEGGRTHVSRIDKDKVTELHEAEHTIQFLHEEIAEKEAEILQFKEHINELNMHAEAQAREYKQKFRELEGMAHQVKVEPAPSNAMSLTSSKAEKSAAKTRGSGSPFKCIGLGITQQIKSEKDEELTAARSHIEELEVLAASRQKEIFLLNSRLASAESMTHDVIRDLLGVKLDMANYASILDHQETKKENETTRCDSQVLQKTSEVSRLKKQLSDFIIERQSWLDEINERHRELVAARILAEKLSQQEQFLTAENELLKSETDKYKKIVTELDDKIEKLTSQHNLQHRIHHHAKIKEENSLLKKQNEELNAKLQRSEKVLSRVKEELAMYRASCGRKPHPDIDEEEHLRMKLEESEEERIELAQKLLELCTGILKVAGLSTLSITLTAAEDALCQIKRRINSLEGEVQNLKLECKVSCEKIRLSELMQQQFSDEDV